MTDKIQEITQKIYNEGIVKAKEEADQLLEDARKEAAGIVEEAKRQSDKIIMEASICAEEMRKNTNSEIQLAAQQFISNLKQQVTGLITSSQVDQSVTESFQDTNLVKDLILEMVKKWDMQSPDQRELSVLLPEKDRSRFNAFFESKVFETLNSKITVTMDPSVKTGFRIGPANGGYILSFSEKEFENYFKTYLKDKTRKLLFDPD